MADEILTFKKTAELFGWDEAYLRMLVNRKRIPFHNVMGSWEIFLLHELTEWVRSFSTDCICDGGVCQFFDSLNLRTRVRNLLNRYQVFLVEDFLSLTHDEVCGWNGGGEVIAADIARAQEQLRSEIKNNVP